MQKIATEALIHVDIKTVWECYTDPKCIQGWAFASPDWECPHATNDLTVGGRFLTRMQAKDQSAGFDFTGTYTDVEPLKRIAYVMDTATNEDVGRACEITFEAMDDHTTRIVVAFDPETTNPAEMQKSGWQSILDTFKTFVESI